MIKRIEGKYDTTQANQGKVHAFLGMVLDYQEKGKINMIMEAYRNKIFYEHNIAGAVTTPATNHLFRVNPNAEKVVKKYAAEFHTITMNYYSYVN